LSNIHIRNAYVNFVVKTAADLGAYNYSFVNLYKLLLMKTARHIFVSLEIPVPCIKE